jgi:hypothetical protein
MRNPIEIDYSHSRAVIQEIGERLRTLLKEDRELPASLRLQIDRLRQANNLQQSWRFDWEPPMAVFKGCLDD